MPRPDAVAEALVPVAVTDAFDGGRLGGSDDGPAVPDLPHAASDVGLDATTAPDADDDTWEPVDDPPPATYTGQPVDPATLPKAAFTDVTKDYGLDPEAVHGACVAVADFDNNGHDDFAVVPLTTKTAKIHTILLGDDGPQHALSNVDTTELYPAFGCAAFDYDGDGFSDLLLGGLSGAAFYKGTGVGLFVDKSAEWLPYINDYAGFSFAPGDLDGDGDLDVYVAAGMQPPPCESLKCQWQPTDLYCDIVPPLAPSPQLQDRVLIHPNKGPLLDATKIWLVPGGGTQTVAMAFDVDFDGKLDVLVGDDFGSHRLLRNLGGTFDTFGTEIGFHPYAGAMGWTVSDLDGDGKLEYVLAESGPTPIYETTKPKPGHPMQVHDRGGQWNVWWPTWGSSAWAPLAADFDHDGLEDLLLGISANFTAAQAADFMNVCSSSKGGENPFAGVPSIDVLFTHDADGKLVAAMVPSAKYAHVIILDQKVVDLDGDGDLDVVQTRPGPSFQPTSRVRVLRNDLPKKGKSATVVVAGKGLNRDALGTTVSATVGGKPVRRFLFGGGSFSGTPLRRAHFGLGSADMAGGVTVAWPDGSKTVVGDVAAGAVKGVAWK